MTLNAPPGFEANFKTLHDYKLIHNKWTYSQKQKMSVFLNLTKKLTSMGKKASKALVYQFTRADKTLQLSRRQWTPHGEESDSVPQDDNNRARGGPADDGCVGGPAAPSSWETVGNLNSQSRHSLHVLFTKKTWRLLTKTWALAQLRHFSSFFGVFCVPSGLTEKPSVMRWT